MIYLSLNQNPTIFFFFINFFFKSKLSPIKLNSNMKFYSIQKIIIKMPLSLTCLTKKIFNSYFKYFTSSLYMDFIISWIVVALRWC